MPTPSLIAMDAGGTKTDIAHVSASGELLAYARGGPGNYQSLGEAETRRCYQALIEQALAATAAPLTTVASAVYGLSGLDRPKDEATHT